MRARGDDLTEAFATLDVAAARIEPAPDGSYVRVLLRLERGSMTRTELAPGATSRAVVHRTVEEIWLFLSGRGELWRRQGEHEDVVAIGPGLCVTIPIGTMFQLRATSDAEPLCAIVATMPPWPGEGDAIVVAGKWSPCLPP